MTEIDVETVNAHRSGFSEAMGIVYDEVTPQLVRAHVDAGPQHHQPYGLVHGGLWASVVEEMGSLGGGINVMADGGRVVGVSNTTDFLRAHREGRVDAVAEPIHLGRTYHLWQVVLTATETGKVVARGKLRLAVLEGDREVAGGTLAGADEPYRDQD